MSQAQVLDISYTTWKSIVQNNNLIVYFHEDNIEQQGFAFAGTDQYIYITYIIDDTWEDFNNTFPSNLRTSVETIDDAIANIVGLSNISKSKKTDDNIPRVSIEHTEAGSRLTLITPNWCDKTTWFHNAIKEEGIQLVDQGDHITYTGTGIWIDNYHGKYTGEDTLLTATGYLPRLKIYINGVKKNEQDPHYEAGGDYTVDYDSATISFLYPLDPSDVVTADIFKEDGSLWILKPKSGYYLKIISCEIQFSQNILLKDTVRFTPYGKVEVFAPQYCPDPYPIGTMIPIDNSSVYKNMIDFTNGANGSMPVISANSNPDKTWRDLQSDLMIFPWNYQSVTKITDDMEIHIVLDHNTPMNGEVATATFYCISFKE